MRKAVLLSLIMLGVVITPISTATDSDGDGVSDEIDMCPYAYGSATSSVGFGCPDSDGDGVADFEQAITYDWNEAIRENLVYNTLGEDVYGLTWAINNTVYYAGGDNNEVHSFDSFGNHLGQLHTMTGDIYDIEPSPDGSMLVVSSGNGGCMVINSTTGAVVADLWNGSTSGGVFEVSWSNDGSMIFAGGYDSKLVWFNATDWSVIRNITNLPGWISGIDTTPDDSLLIFSSNNNLRGYWTDNGSLALNLTLHTDYIRTVKVSPDGRYVATGSNDNTVKIVDIYNKSTVQTIQASSDVYDIDFSSDGGTMVVARGRRSSINLYSTDTWSSLGSMDGFGSNNDNRGVYSVSISDDGEKLAVGWRRGFTSLHMVPDAYIRVHGQHYTSLMENPWRSTYLTNNESVRFWDYDRVTTTTDLCSSKNYIGSSTNGVSPLYANMLSNYSSTGLWDCKYTSNKILEIPYGRAPGALMVKSGGDSEACIQSMGGLSMAQVRWIVSASGRNILTSSGDMPGLVWDSVVPNDDGDGVREWSDLDSSCEDDEIVLIHRSANRTDLSIFDETLLCSNCGQPDYLYPSTQTRLRIDVSVDRTNVTQAISGPSGDGNIGFTELIYTLENSNGLFIVPLVDNYTHGSVDAVAAGQSVVSPSLNSSKLGEWPLQTDMRAFTSIDQIPRNMNFLQYLLSDIGQLKWEQMGFVGLDVWDLYTSWAKLGFDKYYLLPDSDSDGVWDRDDLCPDTESGLPVNSDGCPESELDDDNDGYTNDIDDCDNVAGTSIYGSVGCPDSDGDGWQDSDDSHPDDSSEWNDTDIDGFGDNSDDCVSIFGNSTNGQIGCIDSDGDGWADSSDAFPLDSSEWVDSDSDSYGDNIDIFPYDGTQWRDSDMDGYGDNNSGLEGDDCVNVSGTSNRDGVFGCMDSDGDGWADSIDDLPFNPEQYRDLDGDGVGDTVSLGDFDLCTETPAEELTMVDSNGCSPSERDSDYDSFTDDIDQCLSTPLLQTTLVNTTIYLDVEETQLNPVVGCAPSEIDLDGDGVTADFDWDDNNANQSFDSDGDGYGDNGNSDDGDDCPLQSGTSYIDKLGCPDIDDDGWSFETDFNDGDSTQWKDTDGDGFGDNYDNPEWAEGRTIGKFVEGATQPDRCPDEYSAFLYSQTQGCLDGLESGEGDRDASASSDSDDGESNLALILGIAGVGVILILLGSIAVILRKKPNGTGDQTNKKPRPKNSAEILHEQEQSGIVNQNIQSDLSRDDHVQFVSSWEELPEGEWLDNDENGVNWYLDKSGRYWYSNDDGFSVWNE